MGNFKLKGRKLQYLAALLASTFTMSSSLGLLWLSPVSKLLTSKDTPLDEPLDLDTWASLYIYLMMGSVLGNICVGFLINQYGRRGTLLLSCVPTFVGWVMIFFGRNADTIIAARFFMGITIAFPVLVSVMYISEIVESNIRGKLSVFCLLSAEIGAVLALSIGPYSYHSLALIGTLIPVLACGTFYFMPETPFYLLKEMRYQEAEASLKRLRDSDDVSEEMKQITIAVQENLKNQGSLRHIFMNANYRKAFFVVLGLKTLQEMSGGHFIQSNMTVIFSLANTGLDENMQSLVCVVVPFPFMLGASYLVDKFGRKILMYVSTIGTAVGMFLEAIYFILKDSDSAPEGLAFLPVMGIFIVYIFKAIGIGSIPVLIMSELFPTNIKGLASGIILVYSSVLATILSYVFMQLALMVGIGGCFLFFAVCCIFGFVFTLIYVPETKGKSLAEIHAELNKSK